MADRRTEAEITAAIAARQQELALIEAMARIETDRFEKAKLATELEQANLAIERDRLALAEKSGSTTAATRIALRQNIAAAEELLSNAQKRLATERDLANVYSEVASTLKGLAGINNSMQQRFIVSLIRARNEAGGVAAAFSKIKDELSENITKEEFFAAQVVKASNAAMRFGDAIIRSTKTLALAQDNAYGAFARMTGQTGALRSELFELERTMFRYGVSIENATRAQGSLFSVVTQFTTMSATERGALGRTTAILDRMGVSAEQTARNMQIMTTQMGMGATQAAELTTQMFTFAQRAGISTSKVSADFANLAPQLMAFGDQAKTMFMRLEMAAKQSGMAIEDITSIASKFNKFDTAADSVGRLNAILGGPYLSTMKMVMTTDPTARMQMMADAVRQAGKSFQDLGYYERLAMTEAMGLKDVGQLALVMRGQFQTLNNTVMMTGDQFADLAREEREYNTILDEYKQIVRSLAADMLPLVRQMGTFLSYLSQSPGVLKLVGAALIGVKATLAVLPTLLAASASGAIAFNVATGGLVVGLGAAAAAAAVLFGVFTRSGSPKFYEMGYYMAGGFNAMAGGAAAAAQGVGVLGSSVNNVSRAMKELPDVKVAQFKTIMQETRRVTEEVASAGAGGASLAIGVARAAASAGGGGYGPAASGQDIVLNVNLDGERIQRSSFRGMSPIQ